MSLYPSILSSFERRSSERSKGFTLVEVLVAISIFTIAIVSIYGIFTSISATKDKLDRDSETYHQARVVLDRIGREIHGIYVQNTQDTSILRGGFDENGQLFFELNTTATVSLNLNGIGFVSVRYELIEDNESEDGSYVIMRTEKPLLGNMSLQNFPSMQIAAGIKNFRIRYFSENTWHDKWDEQLQGFPDILEVLITIYDKSREETPFLTAFTFPDTGS